VRKRDKLVKVLGNGEISKKVTVRAHAFSDAARSKIEGAGGTVEVISLAPPPRKKK
jgi:large subunit ribosomal protein L15